jgi:hypothetical protein
MLVLGAFLLVGLLVMAVLAVDFSRVVQQSAAIHTAADAGAHAGAVQILTRPATAVDSAIAMATANMPAGAPAPTAQLGKWTDSTQSFAIEDTLEANAVRVETERSTNYLIAAVFNILPATMHRTSIAWANAPVVAAPCVRPWALPYDSLLSKLGITNPNHVLTQNDLTQLQAMPIAARRVTLKLGSNNPGAAQPGNYNAVVVPSSWQALTGTYRSPPPARGGGGDDAYRANIASEDCSPLIGVGDSMWVEPGNKVGPTKQGTQDLCEQYGGMSGDLCLNSDGTVGLPIKVVLYGTEFGNRLNGRDDPVVVRAIGGFVLEQMVMSGQNQSQITGYYDVVGTAGSVASGGVNTTLVRTILVK